MDEIRLEVADRPTPADVAAVDDGLHAYNQQASELTTIQTFGCFARLPNGDMVGGAVGRTWGTACEMQQIWVQEAHRRSGLGTRIVRALEDAARSRGCTLLYLDTFSWQAPKFYLSLGYEVACQFKGFPDGASKFILKKSL